MKTRQQYLNKECTHREYYAQFVTPEIRQAVADRIGVDAIRCSEDPNLNNIPLGKWDALCQYIDISQFSIALRECGDGYSMAGLVCVAKEAARQLKEEAQ